MAERKRLNRDPTYDLIRHIATGEVPPLSGDANLRQYDAELDRNDPMDPFTAGAGINGPNNLTVHQPGSLNLVSGWTSGITGSLDEEPAKELVDMQMANDWAGNPSEGTDLAYGPRNTDSDRDRNRGGY